MIHLKPGERERVREILKRRISNCEVWVFGSRVDGNPRPFSDLDLVLVSEKPLSFGLLAQLAEDFEESDLDFKVDLVELSRLSPSFRERLSAHHEILGAVNE